MSLKKNYASLGIYSSYSVDRVVDHLYQTVAQRNSPKAAALEVAVSVQENTASRVEITSIDVEKLILGDFLTDNEILLLFFSQHTETRHFGERWQAEETKNNINKWIQANELNASNLLTVYSDVISNLVDRGILAATDFTSHGNAKRYSLSIEIYDQLRRLSETANEVIEGIMKKYYLNLPY